MKSLVGMILYTIGVAIAMFGYSLLSEDEKTEVAKYIFEKIHSLP